MIASLSQDYRPGSISVSEKSSIISLIPKKKDKVLLENKTHDISLLNMYTDYKILTKPITKRLETILKIINNHQTNYIKGRFIGENDRLIQDLMFHTRLEEKSH